MSAQASTTLAVYGARLQGNLRAPASKSFAQRAIAAALLAEGESCLRGFSLCDDTRAALLLAQRLGAQIEPGDPEAWHSVSEIRIRGGWETSKNLPEEVFCGESGLCARLFAPILALLPQPIRLNGQGSLLSRPFDMVIMALNALGAECASLTEENTERSSQKMHLQTQAPSLPAQKLPLRIQGPMRGGRASIDGSVSSQLLTGLLMALPLCEQDSVLEVKNLKSKPYIDVTLEVLSAFGIRIQNQNYESFIIPGKQRYRACTFAIEGDWSGASCWLAAQCFAGDFSIEGLDTQSKQADRAMETVVTQVRNNGMQGFTFDATDCPDLFPALVALAAACEGRSILTGTERLTHKESNRALSLQQEFLKLGIQIQLFGNDMHVWGGLPHPATVCSHNDHRIAMALAITALRNPQPEPVCIEGAEAVHKSYPNFWHDLENLSLISLK